MLKGKYLTKIEQKIDASPNTPYLENGMWSDLKVKMRIYSKLIQSSFQYVRYTNILLSSIKPIKVKHTFVILYKAKALTPIMILENLRKSVCYFFFSEAVLTCTNNLCFEQIYKNSQNVSTENCHFYSRENRCILHRRDIVM